MDYDRGCEYYLVMGAPITGRWGYIVPGLCDIAIFGMEDGIY